MSKFIIPVSASTSKWINVVFFLMCAVVALGPSAFPAYVPASWANYTVQTCAYAVGLVFAINAYLHQAAPAPGAVAPPTVPPAAAK